MAKPEEFYKSLDEHKRSKSSCTCFNFTIFMMVILVIAELVLFYIGRGVKFDPSEKATLGKIAVEDQGFAKLEEGVGVEVVVTEAILCSKISTVHENSNLKCRISEDGLTVSGKIATFLPSNASVQIMPQVEDGRLDYEIASVRMGQFEISKSLAPTIKKAIDEAIASDLEKITIKAIDLSEGIMVIIGEQKVDSE